eukprot:m.1280237 g.1280237  ORF g.1280237 m.1280237 type:complete len:329 (-) comp24768_c1_seq46:3363-4349(-)
MCDTYAAQLSTTDADKGLCGLPEIEEAAEKIKEKSILLATWIAESHFTVFHTGAGISTAAGLPDFRGPNGVWTLENKQRRASDDTRKRKRKQTDPNHEASAVVKGQTSIIPAVGFSQARPTTTHVVIAQLVAARRVQHIISQNVDGLHLRSGVPRGQLSEVHGNVFMERCINCATEYFRDVPTGSVGLVRTGNKCTAGRCRGRLRDCTLDWDQELPEPDYRNARVAANKATLHVVLGTSLQLVPTRDLPFVGNRRRHRQGQHGDRGKPRVVICNLQATKKDKHADLVIHARVDTVMRIVASQLGLGDTGEHQEDSKDDDPLLQHKDTA